MGYKLNQNKKINRVGVLVPHESTRAMGYLRGIARSVQTGLSWDLRYCDNPSNIDQLNLSQIQGAIIRTSDREIEQVFVDLAIPVINLSNNLLNPRLVIMGGDEKAIGQLAADDFMNRGFWNLAFSGYTHSPSSSIRYEAFRDRVIHRAGFVHFYDMHFGVANQSPRKHAVDQISLEEWLLSLPKPIGLLALTDEHGLVVSRACQNVGLAVPEQVAIMGVGNTAAVCELAWPPLSSIDTPGETTGFEAARLLNQMMQGMISPQYPIVESTTPLTVITRRSTDILAIDDQDIVEALRHIREHATQRININDLLASVPISRRRLEQNFRKILGRSPLAELHRVRVQHACDLLVHTDFDIPNVARQCGFRDRDHMTRIFGRCIGLSPARYRKSNRIT
jgi:LacI family transcriptional regulator